jgi:hypothetical protein
MILPKDITGIERCLLKRRLNSSLDTRFNNTASPLKTSTLTKESVLQQVMMKLEF